MNRVSEENISLEYSKTTKNKYELAGNSPSRRRCQGSNRVKCYNYAEGHYCENFHIFYSVKKDPKGYPVLNVKI